MPKLYRSGAVLMLLTSLLVYGNVACQRDSDLNVQSTASPPPTTPVKAKASQPNPTSPLAKPTSAPTDPFQLAIDRASSAYRMGKSAQSSDDWRLVEKRWQQAIELLKSVPVSSPRQAQVKQKLTAYQQNLAYAQRQANRSTTVLNPDGVIVISPELLPQRRPQPSGPIAAAVPQAASPVQSSGVFHAPIVRREGNTPVIRVMFNNSQPFEMIVDTGASGTLITRQMANTLGVVAVAQANVDTASQRNVIFPLGYVQSIEVGGAVANDVLVAVAGPELDVGLLGHDFFGHYDVTIRENEVEFRER
jgi:predicted aspartyl protease